jgi:hypothetical protein
VATGKTCASLMNRVFTGYEDEPMTLWNHFSYDDFLIAIYFFYKIRYLQKPLDEHSLDLRES